jgi:hypothetical protein
MELHSASEVIEKLGGAGAVREMTERGTDSAVYNWKRFQRFPPDTYKIMTAALLARGYSAPDSLWGMK